MTTALRLTELRYASLLSTMNAMKRSFGTLTIEPLGVDATARPQTLGVCPKP
jgi:hypothetical protein